ncbi:MAG: hypothetical protein ABI432_05290 [Flavobacteriales bacterium]
MLLRALFFTAVILTGVAIKAQAPVIHYFQAESAFTASEFKHAIEEVMNIDPTATLARSDDMTILSVTSTSGLIESAYRSAIGQAGVTLRAGMAVLPATVVDPNTQPIYVVTDDAAQDLARYQASVDQWNLAHPEQPLDRTPLHMNGK